MVIMMINLNLLLKEWRQGVLNETKEYQRPEALGGQNTEAARRCRGPESAVKVARRYV